MLATIVMGQIWEFQATAPEVASLLARWNLDLPTLGLMSFLVWNVVELVKKHTAVAGKALLFVSAGGAVVSCALFYAPDWLMVFRSAFLVTLVASGTHQGVKTFLGKVGEDKFQNLGKPPSKLTDAATGKDS